VNSPARGLAPGIAMLPARSGPKNIFFGLIRKPTRMSLSRPINRQPLINGYEALQLFDRKAMGMLWDKRAQFSPTTVSKLKALYDNKSRGTLACKTKMRYNLTGTPGQLGYGRYIGAKGSLESIDRDIRHTLCRDYYIDVDIVNCQPTLAVQFGKTFGIEMPGLDNYNKNRQTICDEIAALLACKPYEVKELVISLMFGAKLSASQARSKTLRDIKNEIDTIIQILLDSEAHNELYEYCKREKKGNTKGSFFSYILQTEERRCLEQMVLFFNNKNFNCDVLCYDGVMIRKEEGKVVNDEMLRDCEECIKDVIGYDISLKIKPMDEFIQLVELETDNENEYEAMMSKWEENHFYFTETNSIVAESKDGYRHYAIDHAMECFGNAWKLTGKDDKEESFLAKWRKDPERRTVTDFVYKYKEDCLPHEATLFTGFAYQQYEDAEYSQEAVDKFNEVLLNVAGNAEEHRDFLSKLFAFRVQKPFEKGNICTIFTGGQGVGKDTILEFMQTIIGRKYCSMYLSDTEFWEKHDTKKEGALMMYLQEAGVGANRANSNALKSRITSPYIDINPKGMKSYKVPNMAMYFMTTNESSPVKMEDDDRRYYLLKAGKNNVGNIEYWKYIYNNMQTPSWVHSIGKYLENIDISNFDPNKFPETQERAVMKEMGRCAEKIFLQQFDWAANEYTCSDLYKHYRVYCIEHNLTYRTSSISFGRELTKYLDDLVKRKTKDGISLYASFAN
jgi:hypothetical protein